jgi:HAD superfamily hydrolase (TIGR01509 family)
MSLIIPPGEFSAYLFDCDGTIADTMPLHYKAWLKALSQWNCPFPEKLFYSWGGIPTSKIVEMLNNEFALNMSVEYVARQKEEAYFEFLPTIQPVASVVEHIHKQFSRIPLAVVSGSPKDAVIRTLTTLGLLERFHVIVGEGDYEKGKPNPDPFLLAAQLLKVPPQECLVFEDAELGIEAAKRAQMRWVKVP